MSMYSRTPKLKLPSLSNWLPFILFSFAASARFKNSIAAAFLIVTIAPRGFPFATPNVLLLFDTVTTGFFSVSICRSFVAFSIFALSSPQPMFSVTFSTLICSIGFIFSHQLILLLLIFQKFLFEKHHATLLRNVPVTNIKNFLKNNLMLVLEIFLPLEIFLYLLLFRLLTSPLNALD